LKIKLVRKSLGPSLSYNDVNQIIFFVFNNSVIFTNFSRNTFLLSDKVLYLLLYDDSGGAGLDVGWTCF
jgi:hypothetical protein